ncbi:MAG: ABC transporter ATP-binding protein [Ruminococcaceae bacterium]|nr:ABC transporter ATP-binding protein [Oscillospiraceae bacterium]
MRLSGSGGGDIVKNTTLARLIAQLGGHKRLLAGAILGAVTSVPLGLLGPVFIGQAIDGIIGPGQVDFAAILRGLVLLGITALASAALQWLMLVCTRKLSAQAAQRMRRQAFAAVNAAPLQRIDGHPHGDIVSRLVNDADAVAEGLLQALSQLLPGVITIVATVVLMFWLNALIAVIVIVLTPLSILFARFIARRTTRMFRAQTRAQGAMSAYVNEHVREQALLRAFGAEAHSAAEYGALSEDYFNANFKATFYASVANPGTRFINALVYAAVGIVGAVLALNGAITVGGVSAFLAYANQYTKPFNEVSAVLAQMQSAFASAERLFELADWQPEAPDADDAAAPAHSAGHVQAQNVQFSYDGVTPLIRDLSFEAKPGQRVALVGPTGCGKTTVINLLMRFYEIDGGEITVDGADARKIKRNALRGLYGMVLQDTWLKQATVRENIAYARPDATLEDVMEAARAAHAHSFIKRLPNGYDTVLDSGGENLSAGQRQLLCIARVMLEKPDMLILDEATSSIDTRTEMLIQRALEKLMQGHTSFIVAHRLSTIESADSILVMDAGRIVERGTHAQLLEQGGFYAKLYHSQFAPS